MDTRLSVTQAEQLGLLVLSKGPAIATKVWHDIQEIQAAGVDATKIKPYLDDINTLLGPEVAAIIAILKTPAPTALAHTVSMADAARMPEIFGLPPGTIIKGIGTFFNSPIGQTLLGTLLGIITKGAGGTTASAPAK